MEQMFWDYKMLGHVLEFGVFSNVWLTQVAGSMAWAV